MQKIIKKIPDFFQNIMTISLIIVGVVLSFCLVLEVTHIVKLLITTFNNPEKYLDLVESIIIFFLCFEFIALIMKYFKNNFHFPLRYFIYIGITAIIRLIIVEHDSALNILFWALAILVLVISFILVDKFIKRD